MSHTLRSTSVADEQAAKQARAVSNRIRGLFTQIRPAPDKAIGPHLELQDLEGVGGGEGIP